MHTGQEVELTITHLGGMGDGVARLAEKAVFVPLAAPGDRIKAVIESISKDSARAALAEILEPGPQRHTPPCVHFGTCGGCALQHIAPEPYHNFKRDILKNIVRRLGYDPAVVRDLVEAGTGARRRAEFSISVHKSAVSLGFLERRSHRVIDLAMCPVTHDAILALLPALRECIAGLGRPGNIRTISLTAVENGLDAMLSLAAPLSASDRGKMAAFAENQGLLRLAARDDTGALDRIHERGAVLARFGEVAVELPPGAFLQATREGEKAITAFILKHAAHCRNLVEFYSGCGSWSFPLARAGHRVAAYEGSAEMVTAMHNAVLRHGLETRISAQMRDLYRTPLKARELERFDAAVINPPRNGAEPQVRQLAASGIGSIVMVSCNPATFARDGAILRDHGYDLIEALPIDQFLWSPHLELAAAFRRARNNTAGTIPESP